MLIICHTHSKDTRANTMVIGYLVTKNGTSGCIHDFFTVMRLFLTFRWSGSVPAVRKEKRMYFDAKEFGKRLHDVRTSRGITQEELASKQYVSRMENGERSCSIDLLIELFCILHVSTDYLLMGSEPSKEEVKNDLLSIISDLSTIAKKI